MKTSSAPPSRKNPNRPVSITDVAALAGVSIGSASRAINAIENVTPQVREKVMAAVAALGYKPNYAARSLRARTSKTIGCMLTDVTNPLYARLFRALEERLVAAGYMILLANGLNRPARELDILSTFKSRGMDGVLIAPGAERNAEVHDAIAQLGIPTVVLDRDMSPEQDHVQFDHASGVQSVVSDLLAQGHRRIALVVTGTQNRPMRRRIEGWQAGFAAQGLAGPEDLILRLPESTSPAFQEAAALLARTPRPTAVITLGTSVLYDVLNAVNALQLKIPKDISIVSLGDPPFARSYVPPISALRHDIDLIASECVRLLLDRVQGRVTGEARNVQIRNEFIARGSCGPAPR